MKRSRLLVLLAVVVAVVGGGAVAWLASSGSGGESVASANRSGATSEATAGLSRPAERERDATSDEVATSSAPQAFPSTEESPAPALRVLVVDGRGAPVRNAVLTPEPRFARTQFTDADGRAAFERLSPKVTTLAYAASGFLRGEVRLEEHAGELRIVLRDEVGLVVHLEAPDELDPTQLDLILSRLRPPASGDGESRWVAEDGVHFDTNGTVTLEGIPHGQALVLLVSDAAGGIGLAREEPPLAAGETRTVIAALDDPGLYLEARVVGPDGTPLVALLAQDQWRSYRRRPDSLVTQLRMGIEPGDEEFRDPDEHFDERLFHAIAVSAADGSLFVGPLFANEHALVLNAEDHAPRAIRAEDLAPLGTPPRVIELEAGSDVVLEPSPHAPPYWTSSSSVRVLLDGVEVRVEAEYVGVGDPRLRLARIPATATLLLPYLGQRLSVAREHGEAVLTVPLPPTGWLRVESPSVWDELMLERTESPAGFRRFLRFTNPAEVAVGTYRAVVTAEGPPERHVERTNVQIRAGETTVFRAP